MSDFLPARQFGALPSRTDRRVGRALDRLGGHTSMEIARVRAIERVEIAKLEAVGAVSDAAIDVVAGISAKEAIRSQQVPHAAARLKFIADSATAAAGGVVDGLTRELR